jgi:hypothetical protein
MSSPEAEPIEKLMLKLTTKVHFYSSARQKLIANKKPGLYIHHPAILPTP